KNLKRHEKQHEHQRPFQCLFCQDKDFDSKKRLEDHVSSRHPEHSTVQLMCEICGARFRMHRSFSEHQKRHKNRGQYQCNECTKFKSSLTELRCHEKLHLKQHICSSCGKQFATKATLRRHKDETCTPTVDVPPLHHCSSCGKKFSRIRNLKRHEETHHQKKKI